MRFIQKVSATPLSKIAKVIDSLASGDDKTTNAPSIRAVFDEFGKVYDKIDDVNDELDEHTIKAGDEWTPTDAPLPALILNDALAITVPCAKIIEATSATLTGAVTVYSSRTGTFETIALNEETVRSVTLNQLGIQCSIDITGYFDDNADGVAIASSKDGNGMHFLFS